MVQLLWCGNTMVFLQQGYSRDSTKNQSKALLNNFLKVRNIAVYTIVRYYHRKFTQGLTSFQQIIIGPIASFEELK